MLSNPAAHDFWTQALEHTRSRSPATFEQWFSSVQFDGVDSGVLHLVARDEFVRDWVREHFLPTLVEQLRGLLGEELSVQWRILNHLEAPICVPPSVREGSVRPSVAPQSHSSSVSQHSAVVAAPQALTASERANDQWGATTQTRTLGRAVKSRPGNFYQREGASQGGGATPVPVAQLNSKYTFENFIVGSSNELAYAAAYASAGGGGPRYNPLFIAGGTGLGKTHLMHAIAHKILVDRPDARIVYVSAEHFTNEFIEALQNHRMEEFRARYRSHCDVLLLDDIQFLAGREQTQEEFFHTFNALHDSGVPIIVTSDKYPQQLQRMPERLVSRFTSGLVADVQAPQLETRVAILKKKAQIEGIQLPDSVAVLLAQNVKSNVRELEGSLIRLAAKASLTGRAIDEALIQGELALVTAPSQRIMSVSDIQRAVCNHFRVTNADLLSKDRHKSVAFARQVAMYLCRQRLKSSFPELGRAFGNRDHTTVMSAVRRVESLRKRDPQVNAHLEAIERRLVSNEES